MEIVRSVNRSWIYDSYFSLYRPMHPRGNVRGNCPGEFFEYHKICATCVYLIYDRRSDDYQTLFVLKVTRLNSYKFVFIIQ